MDGSRNIGAPQDWSALMARAQDGDRRAYRLLLEGITPYLRKLAARCFKEPTDIDDAVQDVLLTIHMVRHAYDPRRPFGPWLVAIAHRRIIDRLRRETRWKAREVALTAEHETFVDAATNNNPGTFDEAVLVQSIERLSRDQRQAITMLKLNEMSLKEAAAASGRSVVALKVASMSSGVLITVAHPVASTCGASALVDDAAPVRRLRPPLLRAGAWLLFAAFILSLVAVAHGVRPDLAEGLRRPLFVMSMGGALATGVLAAVASFRISLPDSSRLWLLLPLPTLALWFSSIGYGCLTDWVKMEPDGIALGETIRCFATLLMTSVPLSIAMLVMLRYAAMLRALEVSITGGLAVAAITAFALSLFHDLDASVMILVWNLGVAALIAGFASLFGRSLFAWMAARLMPNPARPATGR